MPLPACTRVCRARVAAQGLTAHGFTALAHGLTAHGFTAQGLAAQGIDGTWIHSTGVTCTRIHGAWVLCGTGVTNILCDMGVVRTSLRQPGKGHGKEGKNGKEQNVCL